MQRQRYFFIFIVSGVLYLAVTWWAQHYPLTEPWSTVRFALEIILIFSAALNIALLLLSLVKTNALAARWFATSAAILAWFLVAAISDDLFQGNSLGMSVKLRWTVDVLWLSLAAVVIGLLLVFIKGQKRLPKL